MVFLRAVLVLVLGLTLVGTSSTFAAGREIAPRALEPGYSVSYPDVAYAGGRFLTIWLEDMGWIGTSVKGALADPSGNRVSPKSFVVLHERPFSMDLVGAGDRFVLFWRGFDGELHMTSLDLNGQVFADRTIAVAGRAHGVTAAWNGSRFLIAGSFSDGHLVDPQGNVEVGPIALDVYDPTIVPRVDGFVLVTALGDVVVHTLSNAGALTTVTLDRPTGSAPYDRGANGAAATLRSDGSVLAVWAYGSSLQKETELRSAVIASDGSVSARQMLLSQQPAIIAPLHLLPSADGATLLVRYGRNLRTVRVDRNGLALSELSIPGPELLQIAVAEGEGARVFVAGSIDEVLFRGLKGFVVGVDGHATEPAPLAFAPVAQSAPLLGSGAGLHIALWEEGTPNSPRARTASLSRDGTTLRTDTLGEGLFVSEPVWNGNEYLVLYHASERLLAVRLDAFGEIVEASVIAQVGLWSTPIQRNLVAGWTGTQWMAAWGEDRDIRIAFITPNGVVSDPAVFPIDVRPFAAARPLAMALTATGPVFMWKDDLDLFAIRLTSAGETVGTPLQLPLHDSNSYSMATSGEEVVAMAGNRAVALRTTGDALGVTAERQFRGAGAVVWDGREYVLAYRQHRFVWTLEVVRFDGALNLLTEPKFVHTLPPQVEELPGVAANIHEPALIAIQEGDAENGPRAVLYREDALQPLPPLPSAPTNVQTRPHRDGYETTWDAPLSGPVDAYQIVTPGPGGYFSEFFVSADTRRVVTLYPNVIIRASNANGVSELDPVRRRAVRR